MKGTPPDQQGHVFTGNRLEEGITEQHVDGGVVACVFNCAALCCRLAPGYGQRSCLVCGSVAVDAPRGAACG